MSPRKQAAETPRANARDTALRVSPYHAEALPLPGETFQLTNKIPQATNNFLWKPDHPSDVAVVRGQLQAPISADPPPKLVEPRPIVLPSGPPRSDHPLVLALEKYLQDQPAEAMKLLQSYKPRDQELLIRLIPMIARVAKGGLLTEHLSAAEKESLIHTLQALEQDLQASAPLVIRGEGFCKKVRGFGQVERLPSNQFKPGDRVLIYAELHNLADHKLKDQYLTRLGSTLEIRTADCKVIRTQVINSAPDVSETPRSDHYTVIHFPIPLDLQPGSYTLRVRILDQDSQREAEKFLPFRVVGSAG